ncbi:MAG: hypothetical protein ABUL60_21735 [Myxococcales bacterium]
MTALSTIAPGAAAQSDSNATAQPQTVDAVRGPVNGGTRRIGLGGAFVALADGTQGVAINPASPAVRMPYSWTSWDYGFGVDVAVGTWLPKNDFYNQGSTDAPQASGKSSALFGSVALLLNYQHLGLGVSAEAQRNSAAAGAQPQGIDTSFAANFGLVHASLAYGFLDGQLLLGVGPRFVGMTFDRSSGSSSLLSTAGVGYEAGVIAKPIVGQYRAAVAIKSPINATLPGADGAPGSPLHVPWEVALGFAYQFGARPLNPPLQTAESLARQYSKGTPTEADMKRAEDRLFANYEERQRFYLLVSSELSIIQGGGPVGVSGATALDRPVISPRLGLESEVIPHYLRLRAGSYYEPALLAGSQSRVHGTGGFDVKLFEWSIFGLLDPFDYWQLSVAGDGARAYLNTSFSIGIWH